MIRTARLLLRRWREEDLAPYVAMHDDPEVAYWLGGPVARARIDGAVERNNALIDQVGYGIWVIERTEDGRLIGAAGLRRVFDDYPFDGIEVGWRLARDAWGQGYASEAGRACLGYGFEAAGLDEIIAFTATTNRRSQAVMGRVGLVRDPARDFDHPQMDPGHPLRRHLFYSATAASWS